MDLDIIHRYYDEFVFMWEPMADTSRDTRICLPVLETWQVFQNLKLLLVWIN